MARSAYNQNVSSETVVFDRTDGGMYECIVRCESTASNPLSVHVGGVHKGGKDVAREFDVLPAGAERTYARLSPIETVIVKPQTGGSSTYSFSATLTD